MYKHSRLEKFIFNPPPLGSVLYFPGLPGGGSTIYDRGPYGNNGAITGAVWKRLSGGLWYPSFDGIDDYIDCGIGSSIAFERTNAFSFEAWVKIATGTGEQLIFTKQQTSAPYQGYLFGINTTQLLVHLNNSYPTNRIAISTNYDIDDDRWHHVVGTYDGSSTASGVALYIEGVARTPSIDADTLTDTILRAESLQISGRGDGGVAPVNGIIALARIYHRALSVAEIASHYWQERHLFGV